MLLSAQCAPSRAELPELALGINATHSLTGQTLSILSQHYKCLLRPFPGNTRVGRTAQVPTPAAGGGSNEGH
jgi:hypothetical protein